MKGELIRETAADGLILPGFLATPNDQCNKALLHVHGSYGNFFENFFLDEIASAVNGLGWAFLSIGTRGRDYLADYKIRRETKYDSIRLGGMRERFQECIIDIDAWTKFLRDRGARHIVYQGHSLGAMKVVHYAAHNLTQVAGLSLLSPADTFGRRRVGTKDRLSVFVAMAHQLAADDPLAVMPAEAYYETITASAYLALYGDPRVTGMFDYASPDTMRSAGIGALSKPILAVFATEGEAIVHPVEHCIQSLQAALPTDANLTPALIVGANHSYHFCEHALARTIAAWMATLDSKLG